MYDFIYSMFPASPSRDAIRGGYLQSVDVYRISELIYDNNQCTTAFYSARLYMKRVHYANIV